MDLRSWLFCGEKSVSDSVSVLACVVDVAGYLEEYLEVAVVKVHAVVFY